MTNPKTLPFFFISASSTVFNVCIMLTPPLLSLRSAGQNTQHEEGYCGSKFDTEHLSSLTVRILYL